MHKDYIKWFEKLKSFVYGECTFEQVGNNPAIIVEVAARKNTIEHRFFCKICLLHEYLTIMIKKLTMIS